MARLLRKVFPDIDTIQKERYELHKIGVGYSDWRLMTRWQRQDLLVRHRIEAKERAKLVKNGGLKGALSAILAKVVG